MGREIRRVPENWDHPKYFRKDAYGSHLDNEPKYKPMYDSSYEEDVKDWKKEYRDWLKGYELFKQGKVRWFGKDKEISIEEYIKECLKFIEEDRIRYGFDQTYRFEEKSRLESGMLEYVDIRGEPPRPPNPDIYMPSGEWYQLFENVSEGTPITPPFKTKKELKRWLLDNPDYWGNRWVEQAIDSILKDGYHPSFIINNGVLKAPHESD